MRARLDLAAGRLTPAQQNAARDAIDPAQRLLPTLTLRWTPAALTAALALRAARDQLERSPPFGERYALVAMPFVRAQTV
jgi:hypothetical protein